jgi:biopolymer transport protein ExbB/TolQ
VTFEKTHRAEPIGNDVNKFVASERDSFESFNRIINYLSDTSGALGLLGTVWGIFLTFHSGKMDGPTILQGMSIALVTTLVGIVISIALNFFSTYLFTMFNAQLNQLSERSEAIRQILLIHENKGLTAQSGQMEESDMEIQTIEMNYQTQKKPRVDRSMGMAYETNY